VQDFKKLNVWKNAHLLTLAVYKASSTFPKDELYGLTSQIRRACASIPANIAEGCGREGNAELSRFLQISFGSANELEYHLMLARDLSLLTESDYQNIGTQLNEVKRMLATLIKKLRILKSIDNY
jgi:four helix bundle protein